MHFFTESKSNFTINPDLHSGNGIGFTCEIVLYDNLIYTVSQKTTLMLHTITSIHINRFWLFLVEMLLIEYAIEW